MTAKNQSRAMLLGGCAVLLWSTVATAFKLSLQWLSPVQLLAWASLFSCLLLVAVVSWQRRWVEVGQMLRARPWFCLLSGLINPAAYYLLLFRAYDLLPAQQAQALNYTWALTLSLLAVPLLGQGLRRRDLVALAAGYGGALVIATRGDLLALRFDSLEGVVLALSSTLLWALYWVLDARAQQRPAAERASGAVMLLICFLVGTPLIWGLLLYQGQAVLPGALALAGALHVGLFEMGLTFLLWLGAMRQAEQVSRVGNLIFLSPFLSLVFIHYLLQEQIAPATFIGLGMIIFGVHHQQGGGKSTTS